MDAFERSVDFGLIELEHTEQTAEDHVAGETGIRTDGQSRLAGATAMFVVMMVVMMSAASATAVMIMVVIVMMVMAVIMTVLVVMLVIVMFVCHFD